LPNEPWPSDSELFTPNPLSAMPLSAMRIFFLLGFSSLAASTFLRVHRTGLVPITLSGDEDVLSRMQWWSKGGRPKASTDKYLLFTPDSGGLNNIRIGWEMTGLVALHTGRTLVLPPAEPMYLLDYGPRLAPYLPQSMTQENTKTKIEDLIDLNQTKTMLPILTWEQFHHRTGLSWEDVDKQAERLDDTINFVECDQVALYGAVQAKYLMMPGTGRREGFSCGEWWALGGPKPKLKQLTGDAGLALLTHGFMWHPDAFRIASKAVKFMGLFNYVALHARYNDFQFKESREPADDIFQKLGPFLEPGAVLYIASDEPQKFEGLGKHGVKVVLFEDLLSDKGGNVLTHEKAKYDPERWFKLTGLVEELICAYAKMFVGSDKSSFSGHIQRMRKHVRPPVSSLLDHTDMHQTPAEINEEIRKWQSGTSWRLPGTKGD